MRFDAQIIKFIEFMGKNESVGVTQFSKWRKFCIFCSTQAIDLKFSIKTEPAKPLRIKI